jgi:integrase
VRKLSKDSIRNAVSVLRSMLNEAIERHLLTANPATRLGKLYREAGSRRDQVDPFIAEEIPLLLDAIRKHYKEDNYVAALTLLHTGLRAAELAGLQWPDLDFRGRFITVRRQYKNGKITRTKTKKIRNVDISDTLLHELQALKKRRQEEYLGRGKNEIPEWVFLSPGLRLKEGKREEGEPLDMKNFRNRIFLKACDKADIRRRRLHDTRHSFASILFMNGESPAYVRDQLGHASIKLTVDIYGHWIPSSNRQAVNKLPSLSTPKARAQAAKN